MKWDELANDSTIEKTVGALRNRGFDVIITNTHEEAKAKVLELLPRGAEVMHVSSTTLREIGVSKEVMESGEYNELGTRLRAINDEKERNEMRRKALSPDYVIGSVHAITEDGQVLTASASGSQIPPYAYGAAHVIWVVGTQKIVGTLEDGLKRIYDYTLPLETERMMKAYGRPSSVNKILIYEKEFIKGRITIIFVKEKLGF